MLVNPAIFRPNDIRGIVGIDFVATDFILIGQGYAKFLLDRGVSSAVVGRDNRLHSMELQAAMIEGLSASGVAVIDIGEVTTPMMYFARQDLNISGGVNITASHNPPEWNGAKLCYGGGAIHEEEIYEVENNINLDRFERGRGKITQKDIVESYLRNIRGAADFEFIKANLPVKRVGVDSGNGLAGRWVPGLLRELGIEVFEIYSDPDGTFPNHIPDPALGQNMKDAWHLSIDKKLDLGLAFDGDVDRLNVIDDNNVILWGDGLTILFARDILERTKNVELILYDVMCSPAVPEDIAKRGGVSVMVPSGHALIAHRLHRSKAPMAGEYSGHLYFVEGYHGFDDAIYAAFRLLNILAHHKSKLSDLMGEVPFYLSSGITNIPVSEDKKMEVAYKLQKELQTKYFTNVTSGLRVKVGDSWAVIHPSGTESLIRLVVWAKDQKNIDKTREYLMAEINKLL
jgi:phosphomannomutase / phosphoglucomutase